MSKVTLAGLRNGFPAEIAYTKPDGSAFSASDFGAGTFYPVGMTLERASYFYWRVRRFSLTYDLAGNDPAGGDNYDMTCADTAGTMDKWEDDFFNAHVTDEIQAVDGSFFSGAAVAPEGQNGAGSGTVTGGDPPDSGTSSGESFGQLFTSNEFDQPLRYFDGQYWPFIVITVKIIGDIGGSWSVSTLDFGGAAMAATVDFAGQSIPTWGTTGTTVAGSVVVGGDLWWGYDGKFDTSTGARL